jgi:2-oxoglutarate dehydrogenase complex dehydrogenase (E1) component-like enzyme
MEEIKKMTNKPKLNKENMNKLLQTIKENDEKFDGIGKEWESELGKLLNRFASCIRDDKKRSKDCIQKRIEIKNFIYFLIKSYITHFRIKELEALVKEIERMPLCDDNETQSLPEDEIGAFIEGQSHFKGHIIKDLKDTIKELKTK